MPFDSKPEVETKPDLSKPSLEGLAYVLRHAIPDTHRWDFEFGLRHNDCGTAGCAIGVGRVYWPQVEAIAQLAPTEFGVIEFGNILGLTVDQSLALFSAAYCNTSETYGKSAIDVTPYDVADAIDRYLASKA